MALPRTHRHHAGSATLFALTVSVTVAWLMTAAPGAAPSATLPIPLNPDDATIAHVLDRLGYGARPGEIARVRALGLAAYIDQQLHPHRIAQPALDTALARLQTLPLDSRELARRYYIPAEQLRRAMQSATPPASPSPTPEPSRVPVGQQSGRDRFQQLTAGDRETLRAARLPLAELSTQKLLRAHQSEAQLEEVLVDFWFNHFNVFSGKGATRLYVASYERDAIRPHVLGTFRDMLGAVAAHPAMLFYLDNWMSAGADTSVPAPRGGRTTRRRAPAAPPVGRLRPRGLNENFGRELLELHTLGVDGGYTQDDVVAVARAFTGWTIEEPRQGGRFRFDTRRHDTGEKRVLGHRLTANGQGEGHQVLDILAAHPATATHIATKLARRFVADDPPPALVARVAAVFRETRGDLRAVTRAVITSPEFFAPEARRAKIKSPFEFVVSALRASGATVANPAALIAQVRELGQPLYGAQPPTGYDDGVEAWVSSGALVHRMNFALALASNRLAGVRSDVGRLAGEAGSAATDHVVTTLLRGEVSAATRETLARAPDPTTLVALTIGAPEFQRR